MRYYTRKVQTPNEEGLQVWCASHHYDRPVDGEKIYPSRQNAYVARDRLQESVTWIDCLIDIRVEIADFQPVVDYIEQYCRDASPLVCLPYKDAFFERRRTYVVDVRFRYMCRPEAVVIVSPGSRFGQPMTYDELVEWLKKLDAAFPVVQNSTIEM